jgi:hypothetical protein
VSQSVDDIIIELHKILSDPEPSRLKDLSKLDDKIKQFMADVRMFKEILNIVSDRITVLDAGAQVRGGTQCHFEQTWISIMEVVTTALQHLWCLLLSRENLPSGALDELNVFLDDKRNAGRVRCVASSSACVNHMNSFSQRLHSPIRFLAHECYDLQVRYSCRCLSYVRHASRSTALQAECGLRPVELSSKRGFCS